MSISRQDQLKPAAGFSPSFDTSQCADIGSAVVSAYSPLDSDIPGSSLLEELSMMFPLFPSTESERDRAEKNTPMNAVRSYDRRLCL
jgi:hypothetical protein